MAINVTMLPMRLIPSTMSTQHPDNAGRAFWCGKSFINTTDEIEEAYTVFKELNCNEYMWDWEGKFVDEAVIDKFFRRYTDYFRRHPLGKEKFLTYRIPNIWEERGYRIARAFINIITSADLAIDFKFHSPPVIEIILPMVKTAKQIMEIEKMFRKTAKLKCKIFSKDKCVLNSINIIPLIETAEQLTDIKSLLEDYLKMYKKTYGSYPNYLRPFIARSDPALNAGLVPAVLGAKAALAQIYELGKKYKVPMYPIIGTGSLPFRGGVNPENIKEVIAEYGGIRTITIQSAFKYDYPLSSVKKAIKFIDKTLPKLKPIMLGSSEIRTIMQINKFFSGFYKKTVESLAPLINKIASRIPSRRERMLHIGLFGYSRGLGKITLPRAIAFTGALYSLGIPPEFIGTGRGLAQAVRKGNLEFIKNVYINLKRDLVHAGKYLNEENLELLAKKYPAFKEILRDIEETKRILGVKFGPIKNYHYLHRNLTSNILYKIKMGKDPSTDIIEAAKIRKSLG
ncbi:phosphoenolpyruvate carboxylase [Candidatus Peregrinibacteria bacterium]|nr:phosphoenolpyruvate carboxylase [Candidatus Peregrinibacteria bacterium]